jgi:DNA helicase-2/ATP-dependent DNA helicase PcrA
MITLPELTPEYLASLEKNFPDCRFASVEQKEFLGHNGPCDVQAAPGHGKTTLIVAKIAVLADAWKSRSSGVFISTKVFDA